MKEGQPEILIKDLKNREKMLSTQKAVKEGHEIKVIVSIIKLKLNLWLTVPKGATPVN